MHFEVTMNTIELRQGGYSSAAPFEQGLKVALIERHMGWVKRSGAGISQASIEVEVTDDYELMDAVEALCEVLRALEAPPSTKIHADMPRRYSWLVWDM